MSRYPKQCKGSAWERQGTDRKCSITFVQSKGVYCKGTACGQHNASPYENKNTNIVISNTNGSGMDNDNGNR